MPDWSAINSGIGRRCLLAVGVALAALLVAFVCVTARDAGLAEDAAQARRLDDGASRIAATLAVRVQAGEAIAELLTGADIGRDGLLLRESLESARAFRALRLLSFDPDGRANTGDSGLVLSATQRSTLRAGGAVVAAARLGDDSAGLHLLRRVRAGGTTRVAALEFAPEWLWPAPDARVPQVLVLAPGAGALLSDGVLAPDLLGLFEAQFAPVLRPGDVRRLSWQADGDAWVGTLAAFAPLGSHSQASLAVIVAEPRPPLASRFAAVARPLPLLVAFAAGLALLVAASLASAWAPAIAALRRGIADLRSDRAVTLRVAGARDEPRALVEGFNRAAAAVMRRTQTLRTLGEIDSLLLASGDLESVLDGVLMRVREVTRCRVAGIALIDGEAPPHGRIFLACSGGGQWPVARVDIDEELLDALREANGGMTIARFEEGRHSLVAPLVQVGAQFLWAWPVFAGDRLGAVLTVGYDDPDDADANLAGYGTDCAQRLGAALSSSARAEALYRQAHFDPLTQLPNRLLFRDRLAQELSAVSADASRGALLYIDLDHFKKINDSLGHEAGDQVLAITAQRLRACVKEGDTVARLAGDEFTVILRQVADPAAASAVADRIVETLQLPVNIAGQDHHVRASIGITLYPDDGADIETLMRNADLAMYRAKSLGRGAAVFFDRRMTALDRRTADSGLHRALKRREFSLFYQPQYNLADGRLLAVEALLRWNSGRDNERAPRDFVPAAEESGLIVDIGSWVLEAACAQVASWRDAGLLPPRVAVNVAPQQLRTREIVQFTRRLLDRHGLQGQMLEMELTEAAFLDPESEATLGELSRMGVRLTLDDFGTGYSALGHLRRYPVKTVKIDRSFIDDVPGNAASAALAETIIVMAHKLGKQVVAEGVENIEQLDFLRERGCDIVQGYYLARPLSAADMAGILEGRIATWQPGEAAAG